MSVVKDARTLVDVTADSEAVADGGLTLTASGAVAARLKELRRRRGWSAAKLAEQCARAGAPGLTASVLANIETGRPDAAGTRRRDITVDELLTLAYVLNVAPLHLLVLPAEREPGTAMHVLPGTTVTDPDLLTRWLRGEEALPGTDHRAYYTAAVEHAPLAGTEQSMADYARTVLQDRAKQIVSSPNRAVRSARSYLGLRMPAASSLGPLLIEH